MGLASLNKSLQVLDLLSQKPRGLSLVEMSRSLGLPKSSIHHILSTFISHDFVAQDKETKRYSLGFKFLSICKVILDNIDIRNIARDYLYEIHEKTNETVHLAILQKGKVIYIDKIDSTDGLSLATYIGFSTDPHAAAGGKVLLSELSQREIMGIYRDRGLTVYATNTIRTRKDLLDELKKVKRQGYAIDDEEYYEGVRCVAAPVRAGGKIVAALSITGSVFTITMERIDQELKKLVIETAEKISSQMRW